MSKVCSRCGAEKDLSEFYACKKHVEAKENMSKGVRLDRPFQPSLAMGM